MAPESREFGPFGSGVYERPRRSKLRAVANYLALFLFAVFLPAALLGWSSFYENFAEREAPVIKVLNPPFGLGLEPREIKFEVSDANSGIDEVIVRLAQGSRMRDVLRKRYDKKQLTDELTLSFNGSDFVDGGKANKAVADRLVEGEAELTFIAFDRSFWGNTFRAQLDLRIDFHKPELKVLSTQHNAVIGGSQLVVYELDELQDTFTGVKVGAELYPGFPARAFDPAFKPFPALFVVLFPVPLGFEVGKDQVKVFGRDSVGNMGTAQPAYRVQNPGSRDRSIAVSAELLDPKLDELFRSYLDKQAKIAGSVAPEPLPIQSESDRLQRFTEVNKNYRELVETAVRPLFARPKSERFWDERFVRPGGREISNFGERVAISVNGRELGRFVETGARIGLAAETPVRVANGGVVIFADDLGVYGKTVIVDHGFGLTSQYSYLSAVSRVEGDRIQRGEVVGRVGETGLAFGPTLGFEMRLHGVPIRSVEWADPNWVQGQVNGKLDEVKRGLGLRVMKELP